MSPVRTFESLTARRGAQSVLGRPAGPRVRLWPPSVTGTRAARDFGSRSAGVQDRSALARLWNSRRTPPPRRGGGHNPRSQRRVRSGPSAFGEVSRQRCLAGVFHHGAQPGWLVTGHRPTRPIVGSHHHRPAASLPVLRPWAAHPLRPPPDRASAPALALTAALPRRPPPDPRRHLTTRSRFPPRGPPTGRSMPRIPLLSLV